ncbi:MAG: UDP-N-acetylmuramoyl-L-alanyl-D-glutamate--2,6-diaminopimelate ligase [Thioalkalivibrio sp.]|nr:MAG: UDP-N-acetylmuramoyl-L-alanyl-D-glutamate--2,6-diaminopimelate ligase [Thioalkalivibrio sp.]
MPLSRLLPECRGLPEIRVRGLSMSSRDLSPGAAFVALRGTRAHGLEFAADALRQGAVAVLWDEGPGVGGPRSGDPRFVHVSGLRERLPELARRLFGAWPEQRPLIAITGTDGKTSVSHQISGALAGLGLRCAVIGTLGAGAPDTLAPTGHTTPDVLQLHRLLAELARDGYDAVALEASSHALVQGRLEGLRPTVAVLTHLGRDHLDYHGSMAAYGEAKSRLFRMPGLRAAVLNADDALGRRLLEEIGRDPARVAGCWTYGTGPAPGAAERHLRAGQVTASGDGLAFDVAVGSVRGRVQAPLLGTFQVANLLAALGTLLALGHPPEPAIRALGGVRGVPGRMERFTIPDGAVLVVDYAHTALALQSALLALRPHTEGRLRVVFGCGGNRDPGKRPMMGEVASRLADEVIVTDDNPRDEDPAAIRREVLAGCVGPAAVREIGSRAEAIETAVAASGAGDIVLIAGKGHEATQTVAGVELPFSDRDAARRLAAGGGGA